MCLYGFVVEEKSYYKDSKLFYFKPSPLRACDNQSDPVLLGSAYIAYIVDDSLKKKSRTDAQ